MDMTKVTLKNLHECYWDRNRNIYVNGEITEGFSEEEIKMAILNGCDVICSPSTSAKLLES